MIEKICSERRLDIVHQRFIAKIGYRNAQEFLSQVKAGEKVYCITELSDVTFLEKDVPPYLWVKFKTSDGLEKIQHPACFRIISKGNKLAEYIVEGNDYENRVKKIEREARGCGFRVEKKKLKNSYKLRIFGDKQDQVDDFVILFCQNAFTFY
ncbi:MAG: hypothetical protein ACFE85_16505 [Candidatus Hodarchaeota archaeon]